MGGALQFAMATCWPSSCPRIRNRIGALLPGERLFKNTEGEGHSGSAPASPAALLPLPSAGGDGPGPGQPRILSTEDLAWLHRLRDRPLLSTARLLEGHRLVVPVGKCPRLGLSHLLSSWEEEQAPVGHGIGGGLGQRLPRCVAPFQQGLCSCAACGPRSWSGGLRPGGLPPRSGSLNSPVGILEFSLLSGLGCLTC